MVPRGCTLCSSWAADVEKCLFSSVRVQKCLKGGRPLLLAGAGGRTSGTKKSLQDQCTLLFHGNKADEITRKHIWGNCLHQTVNKSKLNLTEGEHLVSEAELVQISRGS